MKKMKQKNGRIARKIASNEDRTPVYQFYPATTAGDTTGHLPIDPQTGQPLAPMAQPGYYPGFSTLSQQAFWDEATRKVVLNRVHNVPPIRFFTPEQFPFMMAVCDRLLPQDDRDNAHKIPVVNYIDQRLYENKLNGYQYADMPPDREAIIMGLQGIEEIAQHMYDQSFIQLGHWEQESILRTIHQDQPPAGHAIWQRVPPTHFWALIMQDVVQAYYAHPYAWDEIGFGGPAYPRGYTRLSDGKPEPWEVEEERYDWEAPPTSLSDHYEPIGGPHEHARHAIGQGGTH
jgi:hypothetical protein